MFNIISSTPFHQDVILIDSKFDSKLRRWAFFQDKLNRMIYEILSRLPSQHQHILARLKKHASHIEDEGKKSIIMCVLEEAEMTTTTISSACFVVGLQEGSQL